jgi:hypothetical protein
MTTRPLLFDSPFLLGFDHTRALIERAAKAAGESYPPYNVEAREDGGVRITLAVAGFAPDQLEVTVEGNQLTVAGRRGEAAEAGDRAFLGASRPGASSAPSCWRTAWWWTRPCWSTACCISILPGPSPSGWSGASRSGRPTDDPVPFRPRPAESAARGRVA